MSTQIKISQLTSFPSALVGSDFLPVDQSSSLFTYKATLDQIKTFTSTGSFSGSFSGSHFGTSSVALNAITSSYINGSNVSGSVLSSSYAVTASYVSGSANFILGNGTVNYLPIWTGNKLLGNSSIYYTGSLNSYIYNSVNIIAQGGQPNITSKGTYNANISLQSYYTSSDLWTFSVGADSAGSFSRGGFALYTVSSSNQLTAKQVQTPDPFGIIRVIEIISNGIYLWPKAGVQSVSNDGTVTIGAGLVSLETGSSMNTESRLLIYAYSGSSASNPQTNHIHKAVEVKYGSGSIINTTFCVSSSGQVYSTGYNVISSSNYGYTSSLASGSFAVIEDAGIMFLFARSSNGKLRSSSLA
jgi:hypothetical protein